MTLSPTTARAVKEHFSAVASSRGEAPAPTALLALPEAERTDVVVHLIREHRAGTYLGGAYSAAEVTWSTLLRSLAPLKRDDLCKLLHAVGATGGYLCGYPWRFAWEQAQKVIASEGISPELHDALRAMAASASRSVDRGARSRGAGEHASEERRARRARARDSRVPEFTEKRNWSHYGGGEYLPQHERRRTRSRTLSSLLRSSRHDRGQQDSSGEPVHTGIRLTHFLAESSSGCSPHWVTL